MPTVTYIQKDGSQKKAQGEEGKTVLQIALDNGIDVEHACGGNGFCTTCACEVQNGQKMIDGGMVSPVNDKEVNMGVEGPEKRLGCQTEVKGDVMVKIIEL
jgi:ferredoxin